MSDLLYIFYSNQDDHKSTILLVSSSPPGEMTTQDNCQSKVSEVISNMAANPAKPLNFHILQSIVAVKCLQILGAIGEKPPTLVNGKTLNLEAQLEILIVFFSCYFYQTKLFTIPNYQGLQGSQVFHTQCQRCQTWTISNHQCSKIGEAPFLHPFTHLHIHKDRRELKQPTAFSDKQVCFVVTIKSLSLIMSPIPFGNRSRLWQFSSNKVCKLCSLQMESGSCLIM